MPGGFAPRFVVEAGFLILLGVGAGYADLRPAVIVALLAGGWVLVSLVELAVWRSQARTVPSLERSAPAQDGAEPEPAREEHAADAPDDYPLRHDAGDAPSEEVEAYTRVLSGSSSEERSQAEPAE